MLFEVMATSKSSYSLGYCFEYQKALACRYSLQVDNIWYFGTDFFIWFKLCYQRAKLKLSWTVMRLYLFALMQVYTELYPWTMIAHNFINDLTDVISSRFVSVLMTNIFFCLNSNSIALRSSNWKLIWKMI